MRDSVFLDTNVLVYLYSKTEIDKRNTSILLFKKYICLTSTQALNEFTNVYIKKYKVINSEIKEFIGRITIYCDVKLVSEKIIYNAIDLNNKYGYSYYDCLMLASALESGCKILFSEDMSDGQIVDGSLKIVNPYSLL